ncbi:secernin-1 isoform X3 [Ahaetulla prasina]|uniref:secernin-1 isoform X3 n=1 Tax=Ahaetulla prasina TaxID=499056 RepID=UPI002647CB29|nr:secernin-1 isoform X3 [Ahaetulla prasina]
MDVPPPSYCFVAFPPSTKDGHVIVGKNSARPRDEVQEVVYFAAATYDPGCKVECTYIEIDQVPKTNAIALSRPSWLWGAEMGANEHGVFIANEAVLAREAASETEALLGMDLVRLGLERGSTAKEALDVIVSLLEEYGQGGNYYEDGNMCHTFLSAYLIVDRKEAWVLDTIGKYWAAEKIIGNITVETMIDLLRNKAEGISVDSDSFLTTASMVSILPQNLTSPCIHFFTGTPDPSKSIFKPFIFVDGVKTVTKVQSPIFGSEDPVKKIPRFQEKPDRRHELYKAQQQARLVLDSDECPETLLAFAQEHRTLQALKDNLTILPNLGGSIRLSRETFLSSCIQLTSFFIMCCPVYIAKREDSLIGSVSRCMLASLMLEFLFYLADKTLEMNNFRKDYRSLNDVFKLSRIF